MKRNIILLTLLSCFLILLDQLTKYIAFNEFLNSPFIFIENVFQLKTTFNTGVAFSIPLPFYFIILFNILLMITLIYLALKEFNFNKLVSTIFLSLIISGGLGNIIDRIFRGSVIDFISIWKYPTFNVADIYIVFGILGFLVFYKKLKRD